MQVLMNPCYARSWIFEIAPYSKNPYYVQLGPRQAVCLAERVRFVYIENDRVDHVIYKYGDEDSAYLRDIPERFDQAIKVLNKLNKEFST